MNERKPKFTQIKYYVQPEACGLYISQDLFRAMNSLTSNSDSIRKLGLLHRTDFHDKHPNGKMGYDSNPITSCHPQMLNIFRIHDGLRNS